MREVKRFVLRRSGVDGVMPVNSSYEGIDKQYVLASDFDALAAENARLRAELDAIQGARGEEPLVVATAILGGLFHGGSGPELGEIDVEVCTPHLEKLQCETVNSSDDVFLPLMTVAQHNRIVAAHSAQQSKPSTVTRDQIRDVFMRNGFTVKEGQTDLKSYVYAAAEELLALVDTRQSAHVSVPRERIKIALEAVQNAMEDAYNNAYQNCCGRGNGQCCGEPEPAWSDADQAIMDSLAPAQRELSALLNGGEA